MKVNRIKIFAIAGLIAPIAFISIVRTEPATAKVPVVVEDTAAVYKAKCAMCHSPKAEKAYDPEMTMEEQIEAILKGKKAEKPPHMPAFEPKGMTAEEAKALAEYMLALRKPAQ